ncbi:hypothetical protein ABZV67_41325 [Streptomyces sp. NPDC005065]
MDADLVLSFLVTGQVGWLLVGMAWSVLLLVLCPDAVWALLAALLTD